jgi:general secretion pathway protein K
VALVVVLWIFVFLFVVALEFSVAVRQEGEAAHRHAEETEGYYLALAGFQQTLYELLSEPPAGATVQPADLVGCGWEEKDFAAGAARVRALDEGAKVNLNLADEDGLRRIFANMGVDDAERSILVDSILDWRDADDLHRAGGAEKDYYMELSPPYSPRDGLFDAVEDLLWVRGVTRELFYGTASVPGLKDIFTVDNPANRINLRTVCAPVLRALLGISREEARRFEADRKRLSDRTLADMLKLLGVAAGDAALRQFVLTTPSVVTIEAEGRLRGGALHRALKGTVRLVGQQGFELTRWVDRDFSRWGADASEKLSD